ncbi:MAG: prepilin-type N-terminal cleavage/methylation domain-containing protein [Nitrospirae bacterium]|nr:prepilin-type N-terminal cleavage/methylation domain-containing protein [Nitrospirota bacterium]
MNKKGLTLIELLIVCAIIGILAAIGIPAYIGQQKSASRTEAYTNLENLRLLEEQFFAENGCYRPLAAGVCSTATSSIGAAGSTTAIRDANVPLIQAVLPRFRPATGALFSYRIEININFAGAATNPTPCFRATATGVDGTRVAGDSFMIDCNNNRNF